MTIKVESGIPMPRKGNSPYPFHEMKVGDSFAVPLSQSDRARSAARMHGVRHGKKFAGRAGTKNYRIWRIK